MNRADVPVVDDFHGAVLFDPEGPQNDVVNAAEGVAPRVGLVEPGGGQTLRAVAFRTNQTQTHRQRQKQ